MARHVLAAERPPAAGPAPAKNRIWSTIGGISSLAVSPLGLPVFSTLGGDQLVGPRLEGVGDLEQRLLALGGRRVAPGRERAAAAAMAASTSAARRAGGAVEHPPVAGLTTSDGPPVGGVAELSR